MDRRRFLQAVAAASVAAVAGWTSPVHAGPWQGVRLIAHRGGVVDGDHVENTIGALEAAIAQGYWMVEVDVRRSRDGKAFIHHDRDFSRVYGHPGRALDMDWADIAALRAQGSDARPVRFEELAERCKGRMRLMLDVKSEPNPPAFYAAMHDALVSNDLLDSTWILADVETEEYFAGKIPWAISETVLHETATRGEASPTRHFLFAGASTVKLESIALARSHGLDVVAAANIAEFRHESSPEPVRRALQRAHDLGVRAFQIDSAFAPLMPVTGPGHGPDRA